MIIQEKAKILANLKIIDKYYKVIFFSSQIAKGIQPGQFVMIRVTETTEPLLRRPFSIHRAKEEKIEILYEVVGKGTKILSEKRPGEYLDILGPLGNGFDINLKSGEQKPKILLVAGGLGVAPLLFLAEQLIIHNLRPSAILLGAKTKRQILCEKEFKELGLNVKISTDDGSKGFKGKITTLLKRFLHHIPTTESVRLYTCGPKPMLKEIAQLSKDWNISVQASLDEHMGCGVGVCLGCVVKTKQGFKRVCKEGPVFDIDEIKWEGEK